MPVISIIIATSSRPAALVETVRSLADVRIPASWSGELLLVENSVQAGAEEMLRSLPLHRLMVTKYLFEPRRGKSHALNLALAQAGGDILLFSDDDVRFPTDWVEKMAGPIVAGRAEAVAGGVRLAPHLIRPWMNGRHRAWLASTADYLSPTDLSEMCGANMAVSRRAFDQIGGFDPELGPGITGGGEESLLSWQLKQAGLRIESALAVEVEHHPNPDRLQYKNWLKAATGKGEAEAYQFHHWFHRSISSAGLRRGYLDAKLFLRRLVTPRPGPESEGISLWELSYVEERARYDRYLRERDRPRNYALKGLRKLTAERSERERESDSERAN